MTEEELRQHILSATDRKGRGKQPPFAQDAFPLHPYKPFDYEQVRAQEYEKTLGKCGGVFHPPTGAPHIDVYYYPPSAQYPFWCYVTNGMSDFPQLHRDGSLFRSEMMCASREEWRLAAELLRVLGTMPFQDDTFLHLYHTVPFPDGVGDPRFTYIMTTPPFLVDEFASLSFLDEPLVMMSLIRITAEEREIAVEQSSQYLIETLPDELDTWLIDGHRSPQ